MFVKNFLNFDCKNWWLKIIICFCEIVKIKFKKIVIKMCVKLVLILFSFLILVMSNVFLF